jgi:putative RecB family exonuclease
MIDRPHWSYSQVSQFLRCPLQYYFERIARLPKPFLPSNMVLGSAVHAGLAEYHRHLKAGQELPKDRVQETFLNTWQRSEAERPLQFKDGDDRSKLLEQGVALLELYQKEPPPQDILAIEQPMTVPLRNSRGEFLEKPLVAVVDLLTREDTELLVTEFKTSGRKFSESEADSALQAGCYVHAIRERYDEPAKVRYTVLVKTKTPTIQRLETVRTDCDLARLGDIVETVERAIEAETFYPVESPLNCSGCPFFKPCREWTGTGTKKNGLTHSTCR